MKEVILYVYAYTGGLFVTTAPDATYASSFKGRMIGIQTDLPFCGSDNPKEGDVISDEGGGAWLVVDLCDSAMKSFAEPK